MSIPEMTHEQVPIYLALPPETRAAIENGLARFIDGRVEWQVAGKWVENTRFEVAE